MKKKLCILLAALIIFGGTFLWAYDFATDYLVKKTLIMIKEDPQLEEDFNAAMEQAIKEREKAQKASEAPSEDEPEKPDEGNSATEPAQKNPSGGMAVTTADGTLSIDDLQKSDKDYVMSIYKRFSASEINQVSSMLSGGITPEEKKIIKSIIYAKVSKVEVNTLFAIAKKYQI